MADWTTFSITQDARFAPSNAGTTGEYLEKTADGYRWAPIDLSVDFEGYYDIIRGDTDVPDTVTLGHQLYVSTAISSLTGKAPFCSASGTELTALVVESWFKGIGTGMDSWDEGLTIPTGEGNPRGLAVKSNGDILMIGYSTEKIYTYDVSAGTWDSGLAIPSAEDRPTDIVINSSGEILLAGRHTSKIYRYRSWLNSWDTIVTVPGSPRGIATKSNGDILIVDGTKIITYDVSDNSFDSGFSVPSAETAPWGLAVKSNGDILLAGAATGKIYTYDVSASSWDSGLAIPPSGYARGVAIKSNGDILFSAANHNKIYAYGLHDCYQQIDPLVPAIAQDVIDLHSLPSDPFLGAVLTGSSSSTSQWQRPLIAVWRADAVDEIPNPPPLGNATRLYIGKDLTLDAATSPLWNLHGTVRLTSATAGSYFQGRTRGLGRIWTLITSEPYQPPLVFDPPSPTQPQQVLVAAHRDSWIHVWRSQDSGTILVHSEAETPSIWAGGGGHIRIINAFTPSNDAAFYPATGDTKLSSVAAGDRFIGTYDADEDDDPYRWRKTANSFDFFFDPDNAGATGEVLKKTAASYQWEAETLFDIKTDVTTAATPTTDDRFIFSDEGETGDPMRYVSFTNLEAALGLPALQLRGIRTS